MPATATQWTTFGAYRTARTEAESHWPNSAATAGTFPEWYVEVVLDEMAEAVREHTFTISATSGHAELWFTVAQLCAYFDLL